MGASSRRAATAILAALALSGVLAACGSGNGTATQSTPASAAASNSTSNSSVAKSSDTASTRPRLVTITAADLDPISPLPAPTTAGPQRIVSLATGVGETLVALGVGDRVVGRDETSEVPMSAEVVTKAHEVSAERVLALDPDLVLVDARTTPPEALDQIRSAGVNVVEVPEAWTLADMAPRTDAVAKAVGADGAALLATLPTETAPDANVPGADPRVAFLYLRGTSAIYLLGGEGSGADAMIAAAGGTDVGAEAGLDPFVPLTAEALVALDPDVLLVMTKGLDSVNGVDGLLQLPGVAQTTAGTEGRVIAVEDEILLSFGPRTANLVKLLQAALTSAAQ